MNKYNEEFKTQAVELALASDKPYSQTAAELDVNPKNLYNWIKLSSTDGISTKKIPNKQQLDMENKALLKELKRKDQEIAILKKAAAYFAKLQG
jgi:transposase